MERGVLIVEDNPVTRRILRLALYPHHAATPDTVVACADQALYAAKQAGRNRYQLYNKASN